MGRLVVGLLLGLWVLPAGAVTPPDDVEIRRTLEAVGGSGSGSPGEVP